MRWITRTQGAGGIPKLTLKAQLTQVLFAIPDTTVFKLTPGDDSWKALSASLPYSMSYSKMAVIGGRIWLVSGQDSQGKYRKEVSNLSVIIDLLTLHLL